MEPTASVLKEREALGSGQPADARAGAPPDGMSMQAKGVWQALDGPVSVSNPTRFGEPCGARTSYQAKLPDNLWLAPMPLPTLGTRQRPKWNVGLAVQDREYWEQLRATFRSDNDMAGVCLTKAQLYATPKTRIHLAVPPGCWERAQENLRAEHAHKLAAIGPSGEKVAYVRYHKSCSRARMRERRQEREAVTDAAFASSQSRLRPLRASLRTPDLLSRGRREPVTLRQSPSMPTMPVRSLELPADVVPPRRRRPTPGPLKPVAAPIAAPIAAPSAAPIAAPIIAPIAAPAAAPVAAPAGASISASAPALGTRAASSYTGADVYKRPIGLSPTKIRRDVSAPSHPAPAARASHLPSHAPTRVACAARRREPQGDRKGGGDWLCLHRPRRLRVSSRHRRRRLAPRLARRLAPLLQAQHPVQLAAAHCRGGAARGEPDAQLQGRPQPDRRPNQQGARRAARRRAAARVGPDTRIEPAFLRRSSPRGSRRRRCPACSAARQRTLRTPPPPEQRVAALRSTPQRGARYDHDRQTRGNQRLRHQHINDVSRLQVTCIISIKPSTFGRGHSPVQRGVIPHATPVRRLSRQAPHSRSTRSS